MQEEPPLALWFAVWHLPANRRPCPASRAAKDGLTQCLAPMPAVPQCPLEQLPWNVRQQFEEWAVQQAGGCRAGSTTQAPGWHLPLGSAGSWVPRRLACSVTVLAARQKRAASLLLFQFAPLCSSHAVLPHWCCARRQAGAPRIAVRRNNQNRKKRNAYSSAASPHQSQSWPSCRVPLPPRKDRFAQVGSRPPSKHCQCGVGGSPTLSVAGSLPFQFFLPFSPFCRLCCGFSSPACTP